MMTLEADSVNVQALDMGHIVVDIDGVNITELINKAAEKRLFTPRGGGIRPTVNLHTTTVCNPCRHTLQYRTYHGKG